MSSETRARCAKEFLNQVGDALKLPLDESQRAKGLSHAFARNGRDISARTLSRWADGATALPRPTFERWIREQERDFKTEVAAGLREAYERWVAVSQDTAGRALPEIMRVSRANVEGVVQKAISDGDRRRTGRMPLPCVVTLGGASRREGGLHAPDATSRIVELLTTNENAVRVSVEGPPHSSRRWLCRDVATELAQQFGVEQGGRAPVPLPLVVEFTEWVEEIVHQLDTAIDASRALELAAAKLFAVARLSSIGTLSPLRMLQCPDVAVIAIRDTDGGEPADALLRPLREAASETAMRLLGRCGRAVFVGGGDARTLAVPTHHVHLLVPLAPLDVARTLRRRVGEVSADDPLQLSDFGATNPALESPGVAREVMALLERRLISIHSLASETITLAAVWAARVMYHGLGGAKPLAELAEAEIPEHAERWESGDRPIPGRQHLEMLLPGLAAQLRKWKAKDTAALDRFNKLACAEDAEIVDATGRSRVGDPLIVRDGVLTVLRCLVSAVTSHSGMPDVQAGWWKTVDPVAAGACAPFLGDAAWPPDADALVRSVTGDLERPIDVRRHSSNAAWSAVQPKWPSFSAALGLLGAMSKRKAAEVRLIDRLITALAGQFEQKRDIDAERGGRGNLRYHSARAAAGLVDSAHVANQLALLGTPLRERPTVAEVRRLVFWAEVSLRMASRPVLLRKERDARELLAERLAAQLDPGLMISIPPEFSAELRHARYHVMASLDRFPPTPTVLNALTLLMPQHWPHTKVPPEAVTAALAAGYLRRHGILFASQRTLTARAIVDAALVEVQSVFGGSAGSAPAPVYIRAHVFQALQATSPMLPRLVRETLLERIAGAEAEAWAPDKIAKPEEIAATRYLLHWLHAEMLEGLRLPQRLHEALRRLLDQLARHPRAASNTEFMPPSFEVDTSHLVRAVLQAAGHPE